MKKSLIVAAVGMLIVFSSLYGTYKLMNSRTFQLFGGLIDHVETKKKVVALTFDDGPTENVDELLPVLEQYHAKTTFFLIGNEIEKNSDEARKIVLAGHQIGNHTYSHQRMIFKSPSFIAKEVEKTDELIRAAGYKGEIDFRPPNGKKLVGLPYYLSKHKRDTITWTIEPDTNFTTVKDKVNDVKQKVRPGSIILLHPMYDRTGEELEVVRGVLDSLSKEGYRFVTVNELQREGNR